MSTKIPSKLVNGCIPQGQDCPFKTECGYSSCKHMGKTHPCDFSCAAARAYDMINVTKGTILS